MASEGAIAYTRDRVHSPSSLFNLLFFHPAINLYEKNLSQGSSC